METHADCIAMVEKLNRAGERLFPVAHRHGERFVYYETDGEIRSITFDPSIYSDAVIWNSEDTEAAGDGSDDLFTLLLNRLRPYWQRYSEIEAEQ